jgi:hypothetical protein
MISFQSVLPGCSPKVTKETVTEIQYRDRAVPVIASFDFPQFVERIQTRDTSSHLENPYAKSDASISNGILFHSLETKPQKIEVPTVVYVTDTVAIYKEAETITKTEYVEKELTWWQKFRLNLFFPLLLGLLGALVWIFREPIMALIKRIML